METLESRLEDVELVLASLCEAPRKLSPFSSWLRNKLEKVKQSA